MKHVDSKPRLGRRDWLQAALMMLAEEGIGAVSIERLARRLGVTRGSFYHHFSNREDLLRQILSYWAEHWTDEIRDDVRALGLDPRNTLLALMRMIRHRKASDYDVVIRAWAVNDPLAREVVEQVDEIRLGVIRQLFLDMGFEGDDAENRARLFLYYEMAEPAIWAQQSEETLEALIEERHRFLTAPSE